MKDKDLYRQILGIISPWEVSEVELNLLDSEVQVRINYNSKKVFVQTVVKNTRFMITVKSEVGDI